MKTKQELYKIAISILSLREHSRFELAQKLRKHNSEQTVLTEILDLLEAENYLSDIRFVECFIRSKANNGYGPLWIQQTLKNKQVKIETLCTGFYDAIDWGEIAQRQYEKKFKGTPADSFQEKAKRKRYLLNRGFYSEHFSHLLN